MNKFSLYRLYDQGAGGGDPPKDPVQDPPKDPPKDPKADQMVPIARFDEVNGELKDLRAQYEKLVQTEKDREKKDLEKREEFKTLYEEAANQLKARDAENIRLRVAIDKGLPLDLADRLKGETLEEVTKDADALLPLLAPEKKKSSIPTLKPGEPPGPIELKGKTPAEIRKLRADGKI